MLRLTKHLHFSHSTNQAVAARSHTRLPRGVNGAADGCRVQTVHVGQITALSHYVCILLHPRAYHWILYTSSCRKFPVANGRWDFFRLCTFIRCSRTGEYIFYTLPILVFYSSIVLAKIPVWTHLSIQGSDWILYYGILQYATADLCWLLFLKLYLC